MNMKLSELNNKRRIVLSLLFVCPIFIMALTGIFWPDEIVFGIVFALLVEIPLAVALHVLRDIHKKKIEESNQYKGMKEYVKDEMDRERQRRREKFLAENTSYNAMDAIYFGRTPKLEVPKEAMPDNSHQAVLHYLEGMTRNPFGDRLNYFLGKSGEDIYTVCKRGNINTIVLNSLQDPGFQIDKKTAIAFALSLRLNLEQTQELLHEAGYALDKLREYDCAICFFIENGLYNFEYINIELYGAGYPEF